MKVKLRHILFYVLCVGVVSCSGRVRNARTPLKTVSFPLPKVPSVIQDDQIAEYVAGHFWDAITDPGREFPCVDSSIVSGVKAAEVEQAVADYVVLCGNLPLRKAQECVSRLAERLCACEEADSSSNVFEAVGQRIEKYLYDPNSPLRDDDLYLPWARVMGKWFRADSAKASVYARDAHLCSLNSRGTKAADFRFTDRRGVTGNLYGIKADYTVLFFSNPGCHACKDIIETLSTDGKVASLVASGRIRVLNIYIDEDLSEWYGYMSVYPKEWTNAYDPDHIIRDDELYSVRAIPSLYLLDKGKKVLLKDATTEKLMAYIYETVS